jgi:hypothetical protein
VACAALLTLFAAFTAYYRVFVSLANYDDEGYMTWTVKNFLGGQALYDQVTTVYGPFYYLYEWCVLSLTGAGASSDSMRLISEAFWVASALVAFLLVYRATGSLVLAMCVHLVAFRALAFIGEEPAHPQEACILLLLAFGRAIYISNRTWRMALMGALGGAMAASKSNLGIFVAVALTVGLIFVQPPGWRRRAACLAVSVAALALPAVLMWDRRADTWAVFFCILVILSLAAALITVWNIPVQPGALTLRDVAVVAGTFAATTGAIFCFALAHGSTLYNLFEWLVVIPRRTYGRSWFLPANIHPVALAWAVAGLIFAWYVSRRRVPDRILALSKVGFGIAVLFMCATARYGGLLNFATPFLWLVAARPAGAGVDSRSTMARSLLALLGVIQVLYAYPVAGSQLGFVTVFMIAIAGICFWDGLSRTQNGPYITRLNRTWFPAALRFTAALLVITLHLGFALDARRIYGSFSALGFPGARLVRVEPEKAAALRSIVGSINSSCGTLVTEPGLFSFHLWTGKPAPRGLDHQVWMSLLDENAQNAIVSQLSADPRACVVYRQDILDLWVKDADLATKPLVNYIRNNFETVFEGNGYQLMMHTGRAQEPRSLALGLVHQ